MLISCFLFPFSATLKVSILASWTSYTDMQVVLCKPPGYAAYTP
jgi:hypothetical protein